MDEDAVEAIRDSTIVMTISVDEEGEVRGHFSFLDYAVRQGDEERS